MGLATQNLNALTMPAPEKGIFIYKRSESMGTAEAIAAPAIQHAVLAKPEVVKPAPAKRASKLKAVEPKAAEPSKPKILIFGKAGVGKTWAALDFPSCYYIDTEGGANLKHYTDKLAKAGGMYMGPEQGSQDFDTIIEQVKALGVEEHPYKTLVIDSISKLHNMEVNIEAERLGEKDAFGASKKPALRKMATLMRWADRIDMNVVMIAHEKALWFKGEQIGVTFDGADKLDYELHLCLNIMKTGESRKAFVKKSRLEGFADGSSFAWSYDDFANKYGKAVIEGGVRQIVLATPEQLAELGTLLEVVKLPEGETDKWLKKANAESFSEMDSDKVAACITMLKGKIKS